MSTRDLLSRTGLVTVWLDRHDRPTDLHQNGEPATYSTFILGEPIKPPRDPTQPVLITDSNGVYLTVVAGPRLERIPVLVEYPFRQSSLHSSTASLSEISEEIPSSPSYPTAAAAVVNPLTMLKSTTPAMTSRRRGKGSSLTCAWCGEAEATRVCKQCKDTVYCTQLCASGHWRHGQHYTSCLPAPAGSQS